MIQSVNERHFLRHILSEGDRLDHLAYRYYEHSRDWKRICDANPEFSAPLGLLGKLPLRTVRFAIEPKPLSRPLAKLLETLRATTGVERVLTENGVGTLRIVYNARTPLSNPDESGAGTHESPDAKKTETGQAGIDTTRFLNEWILQQLIIDAGYSASAPRPEFRIGKALRIPPR